MNSLFIGRWQPFHEGHKTLIEEVLNEGKRVVIAIRDTVVSETDPYTCEQRKKMIEESLKEWTGKFEVITIPDISEICIGRKVGYHIRKIGLSKEVEKISGTNIREGLKK